MLPVTAVIPEAEAGRETRTVFRFVRGCAVRAESLASSFRFAFRGLVYLLRTQRNARIHFAAGLGVAASAAWLGCSNVEWAILILAMGVVLAAEFANTTAETIVDLAAPEYHELARIAKDVAAGGVLLTSVMSVGVGLLILGPPLWAALFGL